MVPLSPLAGVEVVELAEGVSGPYCGWLLASCGARVTKVERRGGDPQRRLEPSAGDGTSASFVALNAGKRSVRLDGEVTAARVAEFCAAADVVIADAAGGLLGAAGLLPIADGVFPPGAVVAWTAPLGFSDAVVGRPASELEVQGLAGLMSYVGAESAPVRIGADVGGVLAGAFLFQAVLASLLDRDAHGEGGADVRVSALGSLFAIDSIMLAALDGPDRWEGFHCLAAGYGPNYGVTTRDGPISFGAPRRNDDEWRALCAELGADDVADRPEFATSADRVPRSREVNQALSVHTKDLPRDEVIRVVIAHDGVAVPVLTYDEVFSHPQLEAIDAVTRCDGFSTLAPPWRINGVRPHLLATPEVPS
jgi:crotonobetainyl-CoA:carnitine CoA-transferase CaiB-like acyl-CoA transferase